MSHRREFEIAFVGLKPGIHEFNYEVADRFFEEFQEQDFKNCRAKVKLSLDKKNGFMLLKFELGGVLEMIGLVANRSARPCRQNETRKNR